MSEKKKKKIDPLFLLFEHHLISRSYEDSAKFTKELATDYVAYLDTSPAHLPFHTRASVLQDLEHEAHQMLVKKMYGCVRAEDYKNTGQVCHLIEEEVETWEFEPAQKN